MIANARESREQAQKILDEMKKGAESASMTDAGQSLYETTGIMLALLYVGDQLAYANKWLEDIATSARRVR